MSKSNSPSHDVFAVADRKDGKKSNWLRVGACWGHPDGKGYNLRLEALPLNGASLVIRVRSEKPEQAENTEGGAA